MDLDVRLHCSTPTNRSLGRVWSLNDERLSNGGPRLRKVSSRKEFDGVLDDYITQGYEVLNQGENSALLRKATWGTSGGHVLWALLTVWWTIGFDNLAYALVAHYTAEQVMLKLTEG